MSDREWVSKCCGAEMRTEPENPGRGDTFGYVCLECDQVCSPTKKEETDNE